MYFPGRYEGYIEGVATAVAVQVGWRDGSIFGQLEIRHAFLTGLSIASSVQFSYYGGPLGMFRKARNWVDGRIVERQKVRVGEVIELSSGVAAQKT